MVIMIIVIICYHYDYCWFVYYWDLYFYDSFMMIL